MRGICVNRLRQKNAILAPALAPATRDPKESTMAIVTINVVTASTPAEEEKAELFVPIILEFLLSWDYSSSIGRQPIICSRS